MRNKRFFVLLCFIICLVTVVSSSPVNINDARNSSDETKGSWYRTRVMSRGVPNTSDSDKKENRKTLDVTFGRDMKEWLYTHDAVLNSSCTFDKAFGRLCSVFQCDKGKTLYCEMEPRTGPCPKCLKAYEKSFYCRNVKINGIKDDVQVCKLGGMVRSLGDISKSRNEMNVCVYRDVISLSGNIVNELTGAADGNPWLVRRRRYFRREREDTTEAHKDENVKVDEDANDAVKGNEDNDNSDKTTTEGNVKHDDDTSNSKGASTTPNADGEVSTEATVETTTVDGITETSDDGVKTTSEDVTTKSDEEMTTKSETEATTKSEEEVTTTSEENDEVGTTLEDKMTTQSETEVTKTSEENEEVGTTSEDKMTTKSETEMTTSSEDDVTKTSEENEEVGTTSENKMTTKSETEVTTKSEEEMTKTSEENEEVGTTLDDKMTTQSETEVTKTSEENEEVGTTSEDKITTKSETEMTTKSAEELTTISEAEVTTKSGQEVTETPENDGEVVTTSSKEEATATTDRENKVPTTTKDTNEGDNSVDDRSIEQRKKIYDVLSKLFREHSDFFTLQIKKHLKKRIEEGEVRELMRLALKSLMGSMNIQKNAAVKYLRNAIREQFFSLETKIMVMGMLSNLGRDLKVGENGKLFR